VLGGKSFCLLGATSGKTSSINEAYWTYRLPWDGRMSRQRLPGCVGNSAMCQQTTSESNDVRVYDVSSCVELEAEDAKLVVSSLARYRLVAHRQVVELRMRCKSAFSTLTQWGRHLLYSNILWRAKEPEVP
jgi:hypothetical protein